MSGVFNPEVKARWVAALRSGEHQQGKSYLHRLEPDGHKFCCLGVLCELAVADGVLDPPRAEQWTYLYDGSESFPPERTYDWAFRDDPEVAVDDFRWSVPRHVLDGVDPSLGGRVSLADLNDVHGWTFERIADVVEQYL